MQQKSEFEKKGRNYSHLRSKQWGQISQKLEMLNSCIWAIGERRRSAFMRETDGEVQQERVAGKKWECVYIWMVRPKCLEISS